MDTYLVELNLVNDAENGNYCTLVTGTDPSYYSTEYYAIKDLQMAKAGKQTFALNLRGTALQLTSLDFSKDKVTVTLDGEVIKPEDRNVNFLAGELMKMGVLK